MERAVQNRQAYLIANPLHNDRHWLREAFAYLARAARDREIFDEHNPVWRFDISGEAAEALSDFFRRGPGLVSLRTDRPGDPVPRRPVPGSVGSTPGSTYALLQTPEFVEEFILDRTFEPAVREFGLAHTSVIDPTCGSGHFLLGAFDRLVRMWREREPGTDIRELVERALGQVTGVDINPFAVAIARFRLMVAALKACGLSSLGACTEVRRCGWRPATRCWSGAPSPATRAICVALAEGGPVFAYVTEDADLLGGVPGVGPVHGVVGNPPYITVKDKALNELYRELYPTVCHRQYALTVPFAKRFFDLAKRR